MTRQELIATIREKGSFLCVGLDPDPDKLPGHLNQLADPVLTFNKRIIDATAEHCIGYKLNLGFYQGMGAKGGEVLEKTLEHIPEGMFTIADGKVGDIGNTAAQYARAFFDRLPFQAVTLSPYMGHDSIQPFLGRPGKWAIVLAVTSNEGALDYQFLPLFDNEGERVFERVVSKTAQLGSPDDTMFVVGATQSEVLERVRERVPGHFLLIPGIGPQGGDLDAVIKGGMNENVGLIVTASRSIIYAGNGKDFDKAAADASREWKERMRAYL